MTILNIRNLHIKFNNKGDSKEMNNNQIFLHTFNNIERKLKKDVGASNNVTFYRLLKENSRKNQLLKEFKNELETMGDLRNIIAHGNIEFPCAVVTERTIERIKFIEKQLTNPTKISEMFSRNVIGVSEDDSLADVLGIIHKDKYSQFPVIGKEGFIGFITENGITNWLANNIEKDVFSMRETTIKDVILEEEERENYSILYSKNTLYDVLEEFEKDRNTPNRIFIIIVLHKPKKKFFLKDIHTIITPWDIDLIYKNLGLEI